MRFNKVDYMHFNRANYIAHIRKCARLFGGGAAAY